jgi:hypothetical protein
MESKSFNPFMPFPNRIIKKNLSNKKIKKFCNREWSCTKNRDYCSQCGNYSMFIAIKHDEEGEDDCFICDETCEYFYLCRYRKKYGCHSKHIDNGDPILESMEKPEFTYSKDEM